MYRLLRAQTGRSCASLSFMGTRAGQDATSEHADADLWSDFLKGEAKISAPWLNLEANQVDADEGGRGVQQPSRSCTTSLAR